MKYLWILLLLWAAEPVTGAVKRADPVRIAAFPIPGAIISETSGVFIDLVRECARRQGIEVRILVFPARRALVSFRSGQVDGLLPATEQVLHGRDEIPYYRTVSFVEKKDYIFSLQSRDTAPYRSLEDLRGKVVGLSAGAPFPAEKLQNNDIRAQITGTTLQNLRMLTAGRIDGYIADQRTVLPLLAKEGVDNIVYDAGAPVHRQEGFLAFRRTPQGEDLAARFSAGFAGMIRDGSFARIMAPFAGKPGTP